MNKEYLTEEITSLDGKIVFSLMDLINIYQALGIERIPEQNRHERNWKFAQYVPQVQDPIISLTSHSLVLGLNKEQICKIRIDNKTDDEIRNIEYIRGKSYLFPEVYFIVDLPEGRKGVIMERIPIYNKWNYTAGELNRFYYNFTDELNKLHSIGIIHNDLGYGNDSTIRQNIVISKDRIRLLDYESIKLDKQTTNWNQLLEIEKNHVSDYFNELIDFACHTIT